MHLLAAVLVLDVLQAARAVPDHTDATEGMRSGFKAFGKIRIITTTRSARITCTNRRHNHADRKTIVLATIQDLSNTTLTNVVPGT